MKTSEGRANEWLRNYVGSIDATALWLAYKAGFEAGCDEGARIAERPIRGNGHSPETYAKSEYALETARMIRDLKGPQYLPPRRLKDEPRQSGAPIIDIPGTLKTEG